MNLEQIVCMLYESNTHHARHISVQTAAYLIKGSPAVRWLGERREGYYDRPDRLDWARLYLLGCNPAEIRRTWGGAYALPVGSAPGYHRSNTGYHHSNTRWVNHPLHIASLMLYAGRHHDAAVVLDEYRLLREHAKNKGKATPESPFDAGFFPNHMSNNEWTTQPICSIDPRAYGLDPFKFEASMDKIAFALWYDEDSLKERFETIQYSHHLRMLRDMVEVTGESWRLLVAARASIYLRKELRNSRTSYEDVAYAIRVTGKRQAQEILKQTTARSTRSAFALLPWATSEEMRRALTEVAKLGESSQKEVLCRMGRPPTADELLSIRSKGIVDVLFYMPWKFLEPAATGDDKSKLVARMAKYFKTRDLDVIQNVLMPHDQRYTAVKMPDPLPEGMAAPEPADTAWGQLAQRYEEARLYNMELRMRLLHIADEDPYAAILLALMAMREKETHIKSLVTRSIVDLASELPGFQVLIEDIEAFRPKLPGDLE